MLIWDIVRVTNKFIEKENVKVLVKPLKRGIDILPPVSLLRLGVYCSI